jgi:uncharacterized protein YndB with AHSA1/START domain
MGQTSIVAEPGTSLIQVERHFAAPPELVFRAYTEPELIARWLGPRDHEIRVDTWEFRDGGRWRYVSTDATGTEAAFRGVFHGDGSVENGVVQTFEFEGAPGHVSLDTLKLIPHEGGTLVRTVSAFQAVQSRDWMIESGMEHGMNQAFDQLDELLPTLAPARG